MALLQKRNRQAIRLAPALDTLQQIDLPLVVSSRPRQGVLQDGDACGRSGLRLLTVALETVKSIRQINVFSSELPRWYSLAS
jgi:hypothetical protein